MLLIRNAFKMADSAIWQIWRDGGLSFPQKPPLKFLLNPETLKGKEEEILDIRWDRGSQLSPSPTVCRLRAGLLIFFWLLSCSQDSVTQFVWEITEGNAMEEIWSSVSHLFFISILLVDGNNGEIRQGILWLKGLKGDLGLEMSRAWKFLA